MIDKKDNTATVQPEIRKGAEIIDITKYIIERKNQNNSKGSQIKEDIGKDVIKSDLSGLINLMEISTDDIAGTLVARHIYEVDLMPSIRSETLMEELNFRIHSHIELLEQLRENIEME